MEYFLQYLAAINVIAFVVFGYDKFLAKARQRRVPEKTLFALAWLGGSVGCWAAMMLFRHKTRHAKFRFGLPAIFVVQAALLAFFFLRTTYGNDLLNQVLKPSTIYSSFSYQ